MEVVCTEGKPCKLNPNTFPNTTVHSHDKTKIKTYDPRHDKRNKVTVRPAKLISAWASAQSEQSLLCVLNG